MTHRMGLLLPFTTVLVLTLNACTSTTGGGPLGSDAASVGAAASGNRAPGEGEADWASGSTAAAGSAAKSRSAAASGTGSASGNSAEPQAAAQPNDEPGEPLSPELALGRRVYLGQCASCHGFKGEGQPNWQEKNPDGSWPAPPHDNTGHTWHHPDADLLDIIAQGGALYSEKSNMPGFAGVLSDEEIAAVLSHIKTMWGPRERQYQLERTLDWQAMTEGADGNG